MFNNLCDEVASEKWRGKGKRVDDELYTKLITLHNYLKHHVHNPIEVLSEITGANYEATKTRLRIAKAKKL
jgi:hypothetical protein